MKLKLAMFAALAAVMITVVAPTASTFVPDSGTSTKLPAPWHVGIG